MVQFVNQAVPGSSLLSAGPGPLPPWSENDQTQAGENPKSDNLRPETGAVAWSIRGAGSSRQVEVAWQAPSSLPYTAPPPPTDGRREQKGFSASPDPLCRPTDRPA